MFKEDFEAKHNQNRAADYLSFLLYFCAEVTTYYDSNI